MRRLTLPLSLFLETYLHSGIGLCFIGSLDFLELGAEEFEWLWHRCHSLGSARDLLLELIQSVDSLGLIAVCQTLYKQLELFLQQLVFLVLIVR